jgi:hypothetical protein
MNRQQRIKVIKTKQWIKKQDWMLITVSLLLGFFLFFALGIAGAHDLQSCMKGLC